MGYPNFSIMDAIKKLNKTHFDVILMTVSQVFGRSINAVRDILVAYFFGASIFVDLYFLILSLPGYVGGFMNSPMPSLILPIVEKDTPDQQRSRLGQFLSYFCKSTSLASILIILLGFCYFYLTDKTVDEKKYALATLLLLMSTVPMNTISQLGNSWYSFQKNFKALSVYNLIAPVTSISTFFMTVKILGVWSLPVSYFIACVVEAVVYYKNLEINHNIPVIPSLPKKQLAKDYSQLGLAGVFLSSTTVVDNFMVGMCGEGSIALYNYGIKIILGLITVLASVVTYYYHQTFNSFLVNRKINDFKSSYFGSLKLIFTGGLIFIVGIFYLSDFIIDLLYNTGKLNQGELKTISNVQIYYALQFPFMIAGGLCSRCLSSLDLNKRIFNIAIVSTFLNVLMNYILIDSWGVVGVALSTSIVYFVSFLLLNFFLFRDLKNAK